jgi:polyisoprenoid-binding protein YceI
VRVLALLLLAGAASAQTHSALTGESRLSYRLHHPLHSVTGISRDFQAEVNLGTDTTRARVRVKAPVASFRSGNTTRDANVLELLETYRYPHVEFSSDSLRREGERWRLFGSLVFHGMKRQIDFAVIPRTVGERVYVRGGFSVRLSDYNVPRPTLLWIPVSDSLGIEFSLVSRL